MTALSLIDDIIFRTCARRFCVHFILRATEKHAPIAVVNMTRKRHLSGFISPIFLFFICFQWKSLKRKKLDTWFFHHQSVSDWRYAISRKSWYMFYAMSKQFFIFLCPFSFQSRMPYWDFEANMLSYRQPSTFQSISCSILHYLNKLAKSSSACSFKICRESWVFSNAWYIFYTISVWKLSVAVPLSNQYIFVNTSSWSYVQCASSPFKVYWGWWSPQFFSNV
jgi:hypothetical protein